MNLEDITKISACIGTFDSTGIPISITKQFGDTATVAFQSITLNLLVSRCFNSDPAMTSYIHRGDGSSIRIERNRKGYIGYLEATN
jgi:hypothetical protein